MSGFYNNWLKVQNPTITNDIPQMESNGFQTPFYFGGSQVPINLIMSDTNHNIKGGGMGKVNFKPVFQGKGIQKTLHKKYSNIHLPRNLI